jgi:integrase
MEDMINIFIAFKKAQGLVDRTINDYKLHLRKLENLLGDDKNYRSASLAYLSGNINNTTYNFRYRALKVFFDFCIDENMMQPPHPLKGLKRKKGVNRIVNIENDVIEKLLSLPDKKTYTGLRNYTCILYSLDNGTRPSESLSLKISDFKLSELLVTIRSNISKTRTERILPITIQTATSIRRQQDFTTKERRSPSGARRTDSARIWRAPRSRVTRWSRGCRRGSSRTGA